MFPSELEFRGCSPGTFKSRNRKCRHPEKTQTDLGLRRSFQHSHPGKPGGKSAQSRFCTFCGQESSVFLKQKVFPVGAECSQIHRFLRVSLARF